MNYQHIFHAGNFADVFKHIVLIALIKALYSKENGCCLIDTHAGLGLYDLNSDAAKRNPEYQRGILPLLQPPNSAIPYPIIHDYLNLIRTLQPFEKLEQYPGSPLIMKNLLRSQDQLILNELRQEDYRALKTLVRAPNVHCHHRDAYEFLPAILPPTPKRGLILIDPPYENPDEFILLTQLLTKSIALFPQGIFVIWYPIVHYEHTNFLKKISGFNLEKTLQTELIITEKSDPDKNGLRGSGMLIINAPYKIEAIINPAAKWLNKFYRLQFISQEMPHK